MSLNTFGIYGKYYKTCIQDRHVHVTIYLYYLKAKNLFLIKNNISYFFYSKLLFFVNVTTNNRI